MLTRHGARLYNTHVGAVHRWDITRDEDDDARIVCATSARIARVLSLGAIRTARESFRARDVLVRACWRTPWAFDGARALVTTAHDTMAADDSDETRLLNTRLHNRANTRVAPLLLCTPTADPTDPMNPSNRPPSNACAICLEPRASDDAALQLACAHAREFHAACLARALAISRRCPLCRVETRA